MSVLIDTSIWSLALRRAGHVQNPEALELRRLITAHLAEIIGPIRQELLSGVRDQSQFDRLETHLAAFPDLPLRTEDYVTAAKFFNLCRAKGIQGSNTDFRHGSKPGNSLMCHSEERSDEESPAYGNHRMEIPLAPWRQRNDMAHVLIHTRMF